VNIELLELAAAALDDLLPEVAFVGGATVELWITDPGAPPVRATNDVDVVVEVTTRSEFHAFEERLRKRGFGPDLEDGIICRWRHRDHGLILDAMPTDPAILGFANRWQAAALPHAINRILPSGTTIRAIPPSYLLATKLEAFNGRGNNDFLASRDFADVIALLDGRDELPDEIAHSDADVRHYLADEFRRLLQHPRFLDGVHGALLPDAASQERAEAIVLPAIDTIIRSSEIRDTGRRIVTERADALRALADDDSDRTSSDT
jgi:hypothetical protein